MRTSPITNVKDICVYAKFRFHPILLQVIHISLKSKPGDVFLHKLMTKRAEFCLTEKQRDLFVSDFQYETIVILHFHLKIKQVK